MWTQKGILTTMMMWLGMLFLPGCFVSVQAVEFGEVTVSSFMGQALLMEVELTALSPEESLALQVRQAGRDVYRGANIRFNPVLSSLRWSVQQRDKRFFLRLSTERPVNAPYLNMFFEMGSKTDFAVRALTVWLDADPKGGQLAMEDLIESKDLPEPGRSVFQAEVAELPLVKLDRAIENKQNHNKVDKNNHSSALRSGQCSGAQHCIAAERENVIISAHIEELEKTVKVLRKAILPQDASAPGLEKPESEMDVPSASVPPSELFLKEEAPLPPKPLPVVKVFPWAKIAMAAAGLLVLVAGGAYVWYVKRQKKAKLKPTAGKPLPKVSKATSKAAKNRPWQRWFAHWREMLLSKWRKKSAKPALEAADEQAGLASTDDTIDALVDAAAHAGESGEQGAGKMGKMASLRWALREKMAKLTTLADGVKAKFTKKAKPLATTESEA
jgi:hypothetical protein